MNLCHHSTRYQRIARKDSTTYRPLVKSVYPKNNFLISQPKQCCGYTKEPSQ